MPAIPASRIVRETNFAGLTPSARGKVRDIYAIGGDKLLIVATDRISAFDYILGSGIPDKGRVLTAMSLFWFDFLKDVTPNHIISASVDEYPAHLHQFRDQLEGRSMLVHKAQMVDVECVARGYISGSGWKDYKATGAVCGIQLPPGLLESSQLPAPIFTPATKAQTGHDENVTFRDVANSIGFALAERLRDLTLAIYAKASAYAAKKGIIIADTKFEFGFVEGQLVLGDEVLTPDSSQFWPRATYSAAGAQPSYDKQYVRDYLESIQWNKMPPAPSLPDHVTAETSAKYKQAYFELTGRTL